MWRRAHEDDTEDSTGFHNMDGRKGPIYIPVIPINVSKPDSQIKRGAKTLRFD